MRLLREAYCDDHRVRSCADAFAARRELVVGACHGGLIPVLIAAWWAGSAAKPRLVVAGDAATLVDDLEELGVQVALLPELDRFADEAADELGLDRAGHTRRMAALEAYAAGALLVATPVAVEQPVPDLADVVGKSIVIRPGQEHDLHLLVEKLVEVGYHVKTTVEGRGELTLGYAARLHRRLVRLVRQVEFPLQTIDRRGRGLRALDILDRRSLGGLCVERDLV